MLPLSKHLPKDILTSPVAGASKNILSRDLQSKVSSIHKVSVFDNGEDQPQFSPYRAFLYQRNGNSLRYQE